MTMTLPPKTRAPKSAPARGTFTEGPLLRHVLVMAGTGTVGLMAIFIVDFLSLLYISRLGDARLTAAVGYASQLTFFLVSVSIGLTIAASAIVSRALGAGDRTRARRLAASATVHVMAISAVLVIAVLPFRRDVLAVFGARDEVLALGARFLAITLPANVFLGAGMVLSGVLRAAGDARRAMYVTLAGGIVTAIADPIFIFGFGLGIEGAAIVVVLSRLTFLIVGLYGVVRVHDLMGCPRPREAVADVSFMMAIAVPAILTNLATPVANAYATRVFSDFGPATVAALAIIDRIVPVAFGAIFALSGSIGPILGQNLGAGRFDRIREALNDSFAIIAVYVVAVWAILFLCAHAITGIFGASGDTASLIVFFCTFGAAAWVFIGWLFIANAAFNNLGFPFLSTLFNWGRATLGTIPFLMLGVHLRGAEGGLMGIVAGSAIFGLAAVVTAYICVRRLGVRTAGPAPRSIGAEESGAP